MEQNKQNAALLVMDMQVSFFNHIPDAAAVIAQAAKAIAAARSNNIPVIYVVVGFRQGAPEISANNKGFVAARQMFAGVSMDDFTRIHPDVAPLENEITVTKRRVSAFSGSDLEVVLRAQNIQHTILAGVATSGVVLSTVREAADKDYRITVLADCCADRDTAVHQMLMSSVFPRQADVLTTDEWVSTYANVKLKAARL